MINVKVKMSKRKIIFLLGATMRTITGNKLSSNAQILSNFLYNHQDMKKSIRESAGIIIRETLSFWERARIPTRQEHHLVTKVINLFEEWRSLLKSRRKKSDFQRAKEKTFREDKRSV
jgi:hypothetical protein